MKNGNAEGVTRGDKYFTMITWEWEKMYMRRSADNLHFADRRIRGYVVKTFFFSVTILRI